MDEFLTSLAPSDRDFYSDVLISETPNGNGKYSVTNVWQKTHRMYVRLLRFLGREPRRHPSS